MTAGGPLLAFAVLYHTGGADPSHYDLLFEPSPGASLVTFRLAEWPLTKDQPARKLKDHRRLYLTFEGTIPGGDRGRVDRVADGQLHATGGPAGWELSHPDGRPFLRIEPDERDPSSDEWWVRVLPDERADR